MKLTVQTRLLPTIPQAAKLLAVVERFNAAANHVAGVAFDNRTANIFKLRELCYAEVRAAFGLSSQMAQLAIKAARDAYCRDKTIRPCFRKHAAVAYDQRTLSFKGIGRVSILTLEGREAIPFLLGAYQADGMKFRKGQADLVIRKDGKWFLLVTVDIPDGTPIPVTDFVGVDLGLAVIATDSDGVAHSGKPVDDIRRKHNLQRLRLQRCNTKGAKKKIRRIGNKEAAFRKHQNHVISKQLVGTAKRTGRGIALEDLTHIRDRITARGGEARNRLGGWAFAQLRTFIEYKSRLAGVCVVAVDPRNTSRTCSACGHCAKANRHTQAEFLCTACGFACNADLNAAKNLRVLALAVSCNAATELAG